MQQNSHTLKEMVFMEKPRKGRDLCPGQEWGTWKVWPPGQGGNIWPGFLAPTCEMTPTPGLRSHPRGAQQGPSAGVPSWGLLAFPPCSLRRQAEVLITIPSGKCSPGKQVPGSCHSAGFLPWGHILSVFSLLQTLCCASTHLLPTAGKLLEPPILTSNSFP